MHPQYGALIMQRGADGRLVSDNFAGVRKELGQFAADLLSARQRRHTVEAVPCVGRTSIYRPVFSRSKPYLPMQDSIERVIHGQSQYLPLGRQKTNPGEPGVTTILRPSTKNQPACEKPQPRNANPRLSQLNLLAGDFRGAITVSLLKKNARGIQVISDIQLPRGRHRKSSQRASQPTPRFRGDARHGMFCYSRVAREPCFEIL